MKLLSSSSSQVTMCVRTDEIKSSKRRSVKNVSKFLLLLMFIANSNCFK